MPTPVNLRMTCPYYIWPGKSTWEINSEGYNKFPVGTRLILADDRVNFFQADQPVPLVTPFAYRFVNDPSNPRVEHYTGDPDGLEKPCFSIGWGPDWWSDPTEIDQPVYALTCIVKRPEPLGFDFAIWDNSTEGGPNKLASWVNGGYALRVYGMIEGIIINGQEPTPPPDPIPAPPVWNPPAGVPIQQCYVDYRGTYPVLHADDGSLWHRLKS